VENPSPPPSLTPAAASLRLDPVSPSAPTAGASAPHADWARQGFALLWAASVLVPLLVFAAAAYWSWRGVEAETRARLERTVDMLHEHALRSFETQEAILEAVDQRVRALEPDAIAASREVHTFMAGLVERAVPSGGMVIVGPNNRILSGSANFPASQTVDLSDRDYVRAHREGHRGTYVGEVIVARPQNTTVFSISRRRTRADGSLGQGLIVASFKPDYFSDFYRSVTETPDDVVVLLREDGGLLARSPQPPNVEAYSQRFRTPVSAAAQRDGRAFAAVTSPVDGRARQYGFRRVGTYPVFVAYGLSTDVARHAWYRQLAVSGTICTVAALLLMIFTLLAQGSVRRERAALAAARAEAERRADAERRLRHAQRIDALGQLVGGVAHDFNNVVMAVVAGARSIAKRADRPDEVRRIVGLIEAAADRGARLTGRMLAFARREDARSDAVDVADALRSVADLLGHTLGSGLTVALDLPEVLPPGRGDRTEFETVVVNLVINARDAMPDGGTVTIQAREETIAVPGPTHAPGLQPGHYLRVAVIDQGTGMDPETLARVGEAFFTTKEPGKGTGLGLAMARGFAEQAGGALRIASERGRGTTVTLWLPVDGAGSAPEPASPREGP
jgi:two-component system NtrC family sensor kinase